MVTDLTDRQLICALRGCPAAAGPAWDEWLRRYGARARALAAGVLRRRHLGTDLADDVVQQASLKFLQRLGGLDPDRPPLPYFLSTVHHTAVDLGRRESRHRTPPFRLPPGWKSLTPDEAASLRERIDLLLGAASPVEREIMTAHYIEGRSAKEIARQRGIGVGHVYRHLHRGRGKLRALARRWRER